MEKIQVALIGLGHQAIQDHFPALKDHPRAHLVAVAEVDSEKLRIFLEKNPEIRGYSSFEELFNKEKLDFVIVATPHHAHYEVVKSALNHNLHVLKEKPFATSFKEGMALKLLAEKNRLIIATTLQRRFNPIYSTFFQLFEKIGDPYFVDAKYTFHVDNPHEGWRGEKKLAGGCLMDMGYHIIDLIMWYFGLPDSVSAEMSTSAKEGERYTAEDTANVVFRYSDKNLWGALLISRAIPPKQETMNVYGTRGIIHLERGKIERFSLKGEVIEVLQRSEGGWISAFYDQIDYFISVIRGLRQNKAGPEFHLNHLAFIEAAYQSFETAQYVNPHIFFGPKYEKENVASPAGR